MIFLVAGMWRYQISLPVTDETKIWFYNGQRVNLQGLIAEPPDIRINQVKLTVSVQSVNDRPVTGKVLVNTGLYPRYQYGDLVAINCQLKAPEPFNDFAYDRYLAKSDIYSQCYQPRIRLLKSEQGHFWLAVIYRLKGRMQEIINTNLPEPQASLFAAINFAVRGGVPPEILEAFNRTGTSHLIAISGLNITLLVSLLSQLALWFYLPRRQTFGLITIFLLIFLILIGFPASAVRAAVMGWLFSLALVAGRVNRSVNSLIFAAALMILANPKIMRDDAGFQLSFLAVMGLIYFGPYFQKWLKKLPDILGSREALGLTLSAQLTTLPLIIYSFGRVSLIAPIVNILVVPVVLYLMIIGSVAVFLAWLLPAGASIFFGPVWLLLTYLIKVIGFFAGLPGAALDL